MDIRFLDDFEDLGNPVGNFEDKINYLRFAMKFKDAKKFIEAVNSFGFPINTKFLRSVYNGKFKHLMRTKAGYRTIHRYNHHKGLMTSKGNTIIKIFENDGNGKVRLLDEKPQQIGNCSFGWWAETLYELADKTRMEELANEKAQITKQALKKFAEKIPKFTEAKEEYGNCAGKYLKSLKLAN